jgi:hypothetical protein
MFKQRLRRAKAVKSQSSAKLDNLPEGMTGRRCHCIQASRIACMRVWALDEAFVKRVRSWTEIAATAGVMRLSSRGGNSGEKDAMASSDN